MYDLDEEEENDRRRKRDRQSQQSRGKRKGVTKGRASVMEHMEHMQRHVEDLAKGDVYLLQQMKWYVLNPNAKGHHAWDCYVLVVLLYTAISVPWRICFNVEAYGGWAIWEIIVDTTFVADIIVNFLTAYRTREGVLVVDSTWGRRFGACLAAELHSEA